MFIDKANYLSTGTVKIPKLMLKEISTLIVTYNINLIANS